MSKSAAPPQDFATLYHQAFRDHRNRAPWNVHELEHLTAEDTSSITRHFSEEGDLSARPLADQIEQACRAAL